jgi:type II secretion system protein N
MNKRKTGYLYGSLLLAAIIFFLFYLFPQERVNQQLIQGIHEVLRDFDIAIADSSPAFPIGLKLSGVSVSRTGNKIFSAETVKLGIPVFSLYSQGHRFSIKAKMYGGEIKGVFSLNRNESTPGIQNVVSKLELAGIRIDEIPAVAQLVSNGAISGIVNGTVDIDSVKPTEQAVIKLHAAKVSFPLALSVINLGNLDFSGIAIEGVFNRDELTIKVFDAKGSQADCKLSGKIQFKEPIEDSLLNLSGSIEPRVEFLKKLQAGVFPVKFAGTNGIPFEVSGTFQKPEFLLR